MKKLLIYIIIYKIFLDIIFNKYISGIYNIDIFINRYNIYWNLLSWTVICYFFLIYKKIFSTLDLKGSSTVLCILFFLNIVPFASLVSFGNFSIKYVSYFILFWTFVVLFHHFFAIQRGKKIKIRKIDISNLFNVFSYLTIIINLYLSWKYTNFKININLYDAYELRSAALYYAMTNIDSLLLGYARAINPLVLLYFIKSKKTFFVFLDVITLLMLYSINGMKTVFFMTIFTLLFGLLFKKEKFKNILPITFIGISISSIIEISIVKTDFIVNFLIRRVFFLTSTLQSQYFEFFLKNEPDFFKQSFLRHFGFRSHYNYPIPMIIGDNYYGSIATNANSGLISDSMANFGPLGIIFYPIILILFLKFFDICSKGIMKEKFIVSIYISFCLLSAFIFTCLNTHGLLILCIFLIFYPRKNRFEYE